MIPEAFWWDMLTQIVLSALLSVTILWIMLYLSRRLGKIARILLLALVYLLFVVTLTALSTLWVSELMMVLSSVITRGLLILIASLFIAFYYQMQEHRHLVLLENSRLKEQNLQSQFDNLKSQLNPHFFFNALNTLGWLIEKDPAQSQVYLAKLSFIIRRSLDLQKNNLIFLSEEIELVSAYIHLMKIRYGDNLNFKVNTQSAEMLKIPPMSLQMLVENAVKHNVISSEAPLTVEIDFDSRRSRLVVRNNLQPRPDSVGNGIGLSNLNERFLHLAGTGILIHSVAGNFIVELPLSTAL